MDLVIGVPDLCLFVGRNSAVTGTLGTPSLLAIIVVWWDYSSRVQNGNGTLGMTSARLLEKLSRLILCTGTDSKLKYVSSLFFSIPPSGHPQQAQLACGMEIRYAKAWKIDDGFAPRRIIL